MRTYSEETDRGETADGWLAQMRAAISREVIRRHDLGRY